jgi:hypothetical protein
VGRDEFRAAEGADAGRETEATVACKLVGNRSALAITPGGRLA